MSNEWLQNLKAGDEVIVTIGRAPFRQHIRRVERTTATRIIVDSNPYGRKNGYGIPYDLFGAWIKPVTEEARQQIADDAEAHELIAHCFERSRHTKNLSLDQLRILKAAWDSIDNAQDRSS